MDFLTKCIHGPGPEGEPTGAVSVPIYQSATFAHPGVDASTGYDYSRLQNPTREALERVLAGLEGADDAMCFASGMAAIATAMELFEPGDHIIASDDLYGGSHRLFFQVNAKNGLRFDLVDTADLDALRAAIGPETKAVFVETPSNPMMQVTDIAAVADLCRDRGLLLLVDNTFLTPYFQRPLELGADIVLHSATKYLGGHNDLLAGVLAVRGEALAERLRFLYKTTGACLGPFDAWLLLRSLKTLPLRMEQQAASAMAIATWLRSRSEVRSVHYIGLPDHPGHNLSGRQGSGFGAMISFEVDHRETARALLERVRVIRYAESLGGVESLITYPMLQTHADIPEAQRLSKGIHDRLLRLSVGCEAADDLLADLEQALGGH